MNSAKEPWLAVLAAFACPGAGHIYAGRKWLGTSLLLLYPALFFSALYCLAGLTGNSLVGILLLIPLLLLPLGSAAHAFITTRAGNPPEFEQDRRTKKDPWLAVFLSIILPIIGFFYLKRWVAGIISLFLLLAVVFAETYFAYYSPYLSSPLQHLFFFFMAYVAYRYAVHLRASAVPHAAVVIALCLTANYALQFSLEVLKWKFVRTYNINGGSMSPTVQPNDKIVVWKQIDAMPKLGALVVYENPDNQSDWIKRVVALPGDRVEIRDDNRMYINDAPLAVAPLADATFDKTQFSNKESYWKIPQGHVFVLGDNPARSLDSRSHGPVDIRSIRGIAYKIWWPLDRAGPIR